MSLGRRGLVATVTPLIVFACADLKLADEPNDVGPDASTGPGNEGPDGSTDAARSDGTTPDAGTPPTDFECTGTPWTSATKSDTACTPRQVIDVTPVAPILTTGVAIARTPSGRVGIVYDEELDPETGELDLAHFVPNAPGFPAPEVVKRSTGFAFHDGWLTKIAATAPDTLVVLAHDVDSNSQTGDVRLHTLVNGTPPLTDPEVVLSSVKYPSELGLAADSAGNLFATVRVATDATTAKLSARKRAVDGNYVLLPDLTTALLPNEAPGVGSASLVVDATDQLHLLFHFNEISSYSSPRYHSLAGATWSFRKTVDNFSPDGISGFSVRLAVFGMKKYAAYYFRAALQSPPAKADLRLATWESADETPRIEVLDQSIPSKDASYPAYRVAMAVDKYGLLHLAIIRPTTEAESSGHLEYRRQTRTASGTKWLLDIVDPDVLSDSSAAFVDMIVDENARPHIAYRSAKDGKVKYATRFDR